MKFLVQARDLTEVKTDLLVVNFMDGKIESKSFAEKVDKKLDGLISKIIKNEKLLGKVLETKLVHTHGKIPAEYVLLVGLGSKEKFTLDTARKIAARVAQIAPTISAKHITSAVHGGQLEKFSHAELAQVLVEGFILATYKFQKYKQPSKEDFFIDEVAFLCPDKEAVSDVKKGLMRGEQIGKAICLARDMVNLPGQDMTPLLMAKQAKALKGIKTKVMLTPALKQLGMGSFLGVGQGSANPPAFIEMHYKPSSSSKSKSPKKVVLVGKGVTFDSGGYSLKPPKYMETMKDDMAGGAAVIALMSLLPVLAPNVEVWGLVAAAENMVDAKAIRPGDVLKAMNGKTIEVLNTDAEGRLTLADACHYGSLKKPDYMIDAATLTGACLVAVGDRISAIMGNDEELIKKLIAAGQKTGENLWQLPLHEEYKEELKSPIADLKNIGGPYGGSINGGLFIQEFVGKTKWAHIDIAGPAWTDRPRDYETKGGTGCMVRTFLEFLESL